MQIDDTPVRISSTRVVGATGKARNVLEAAAGITTQVEKSVSERVSIPGVQQSRSTAVTERALAELLENAKEAGQRNLDEMLKGAKEIGKEFAAAVQNPQNLTATRAKAQSPDKGVSR